MKPLGILETCLYARDLEAAERFYTSVLGLEVIARLAGRHVFFRCGRGVFLVFNPDKTESETTLIDGTSVPRHGARGVGHMAFAVSEADMEAWRQRLHQAGVAIETEIHWPQGGHSFYLRDPANNIIELATPGLWGLSEEALAPPA
ncbi:MAG: VOC family protein [Gemmataceae bacterium]|nr:VOC family protein [Gemmataceae bacterium]